MEYVTVRFSRGTGLGNRLFPWARAILYARDGDFPFIAPFWPRWTTMGLLRGGVWHRTFLWQISLQGLFQAAEGDISYWKYCKGKYLSPFTSNNLNFQADSNDHLHVFSGEANQFSDINGRNREIYREFYNICKPKWQNLSKKDFIIGLNIRRGKDFKDAKSDADYLTKGALRTPLPWFVEALRYVRSVLGFEAPALIVSDGTSDDLAEVLCEPATTILRPGCAASDLCALARSRVLIGSGGSSFSAWASYFARCPTITIVGQSLRWFELDHGPDIYVDAFHPDSQPPLFLENLEKLKWQIHHES